LSTSICAPSSAISKCILNYWLNYQKLRLNHVRELPIGLLYIPFSSLQHLLYIIQIFKNSNKIVESQLFLYRLFCTICIFERSSIIDFMEQSWLPSTRMTSKILKLSKWLTSARINQTIVKPLKVESTRITVDASWKKRWRHR
jgi:hypothetical protein